MTVLSFQNGVVFGPFLIMPFTVFSGFFLRYCDAPFFVRWLFHASFLKHGLVGLVLSIFGMNRPNLMCSELYCHYTYPRQFLLDNGILGERFSILIPALFAIGSIVCILAFIILKIRLKSKWWCLGLGVTKMYLINNSVWETRCENLVLLWNNMTKELVSLWTRYAEHNLYFTLALFIVILQQKLLT